MDKTQPTLLDLLLSESGRVRPGWRPHCKENSGLTPSPVQRGFALNSWKAEETDC